MHDDLWRIGRRLAVLALLLALAADDAAAQLVVPGRRLFLLSTERCDLYYPAELAAEASRLAALADSTYAELARRFPAGVQEDRRISVLLAGGVSSLDGWFNAFPSDRIVLRLAPARLGSDLGSFDDGLRAVFAHELAHKLSLGTRSRFWSFWAAVLGDTVEPCRWTAPDSLIEGAAIISEGRGGSGRAKDPLAAALVKQDILEGRYKDFWQAAGAWDAYPFGRLPYVYGGLFSARLLERFGEERYAELWRRLGEGNALAGVEGAAFLKGAFEASYGESLDEAWREFRDSIAIREPVAMETRRLAGRPGYITALAAGTSGLYWSDASAGAVLRLAPGEREPRRLFAADASVERLDLSPSGERILVSFSRRTAVGTEPAVLARDAATGRALGPELRGLAEAAFAGDAIVGIASRGLETDLVIERGGSRRVLLAGGPGRSYASPASLDGATVYCLAEDSGRVTVVRVDASSGQAWALVPSLPLDHLRSLSVSGGGNGALLALSFAEDGGLYRLALVRDSGGPDARLGRQETLLSGSVLMPARADRTYYVGRFAEGEYPCAYPAGEAALALREAGASWAALDPSFQSPGQGPGGAIIESPNAQSPAAAGLPARAARRAGPFPLLFKVSVFPSAPLEGDSAGIVAAGADLADRLSWTLDARYNWEVEGAELGLGLVSGLDPWSLEVSLSDGFSESRSGGFRRSSGAALALSRAWSLVPARSRVELALDGRAAARAPAAAGEPYASPYDAMGIAAGAVLRRSSYRSEYAPPFQREGAGADLAFDAEWRLVPAAGARPALSLEAGIDGALSFLGLSGELRAALSPDGSVDFGPDSRALDDHDSIMPPRYGDYREYSDLPALGSLYAEGEVSANPVSFELQRRLALGRFLGPLYFHRLGLYAGLRAAAYGASLGPGGAAGAELLSSAFGRVVLSGSPLIGSAASWRALVGAELSWAFREDLVRSPLRIALLAGLSL